MNMILLILVIILVSIFSMIGMFLYFTRKGRNIMMKMLFNRKYVVCHMYTKANTKDAIEYRVVPSADYLTEVGKNFYNLNPNYSIMSVNGRLHYILNEEDVIPEYRGRKDDNREVVIQVREVRTALKNNTHEFLYKKNNNLALIIALIVAVLSIVVMIYVGYTLQSMKPYMEYLAYSIGSNNGSVVVVK